MGIAVQGAIGTFGQKPTTELPDHLFNSMAVINGVSLGTNAGGLFVLNSSASDAQTLTKTVVFGKTDLGDSHPKNVRALHIGFSADSTLSVTIEADDQGPIRTYQLMPATSGMHRVRLPIGDDHQGRYLTVTLSSDGHFVLDSIEIVVVTRTHGVCGYY